MYVCKPATLYALSSWHPDNISYPSHLSHDQFVYVRLDANLKEQETDTAKGGFYLISR